MRDLDRIAFVTRRFGELQGLGVAAFGAALVVCFVASSVLPEDFADPFLHMALPAQLVLVGMMPGLGRFYARSFGRVPASFLRRSATLTPPAAQPGALGAFIVLFGMMADMLREFSTPVSLGSAVLAAYSIWIVIRDWPYRIHHAIGAAAGIAGVLITAGASDVTRTFQERLDPALASHYAVAYVLAGFAMLAIGLLDHRLLAESMSSGRTRRPRPDAVASRTRVTGSATVLLVLVVYTRSMGWPRDAAGIYMALFLALCVLMMLQSLAGLAAFSPTQRAAYSELTRAREERFLAQIYQGQNEEEPTVDSSPRVYPLQVPGFDTLGHVALPLAMAAGALVDVFMIGRGLPSLFALALAFSHFRIARRDWPARGYYVVGTIAAVVAAFRYMAITPQQSLDWLLWLAILICSTTFVQGLLDWRLASHVTDVAPGEGHADAL